MRNAPILQSFSNAATHNFPAIYTGQIFGISLQCINGDASAAGTIKLQASNDSPGGQRPSEFTPTNWIDIANTSQTITAGAAVLIPKTDIAYQYVRAVFTQSNAGSTTISLLISIQGV